jgi:hypothetical protein
LKISSSSLSQPYTFRFEPLIQVSLFDLFTLGGWGLLGGSGRRERSILWSSQKVCTGLKAFLRSSHSGTSSYFMEGAHGEEGVPSWHSVSFVVPHLSNGD